MAKTLRIIQKETKNLLLRDVSTYYVMFSYDDEEGKYIMEAEAFFSKFSSPSLRKRNTKSMEILSREEVVEQILSLRDSKNTIFDLIDENGSIQKRISGKDDPDDILKLLND